MKVYVDIQLCLLVLVSIFNFLKLCIPVYYIIEPQIMVRIYIIYAIDLESNHCTV